MKMAVTGATGYIGTYLSLLAAKHGLQVVNASRTKPPSGDVSWIHYDLASSEVPHWPSGLTAIVHLAANISHQNSLAEESEIAAARRLMISAQSIGAKFIFVSSQTARFDAPTSYGRIKWSIEQDVLAAGGWVVRPGQVYGGELRGLFGVLVKTVRDLPLLPAFSPAPRVQPIHVEDLAEGLLRVATHCELPPGVYCLGAPKPVSFSNFLGEIARSRLRCCRAYIPVPVVLIRGISKLIGKRRATQLGLERLDSLFVLPFMATESDLGKLKLALRPLDAGMHPSGDDRRRRLMREGRSLLAYIMKELPSGVLLRRYVRAMEHLRGGESVGLPETFLRCPILLSLLHPSDWSDKPSGAEFIWRLDSATTLAEATPSGAIRFIGVGCVQGYWASLYSVMTAVICEFVWRFVRLSLLPFIRRALKRKKDI